MGFAIPLFQRMSERFTRRFTRLSVAASSPARRGAPNPRDEHCGMLWPRAIAVTPRPITRGRGAAIAAPAYAPASARDRAEHPSEGRLPTRATTHVSPRCRGATLGRRGRVPAARVAMRTEPFCRASVRSRGSLTIPRPQHATRASRAFVVHERLRSYRRDADTAAARRTTMADDESTARGSRSRSATESERVRDQVAHGRRGVERRGTAEERAFPEPILVGWIKRQSSSSFVNDTRFPTRTANRIGSVPRSGRAPEEDRRFGSARQFMTHRDEIRDADENTAARAHPSRKLMKSTSSSAGPTASPSISAR